MYFLAAIFISLSASHEPSSAEALAYYSLLPLDSPNLKTGIEELMKIHYRDQNWDRFFAYAQYYRLRYSPRERTEVQLLEPLALLRHCQTRALPNVLAQIKADKPELRSHIERIQALAETRFKGKKANTVKHESPLAAHFEGQFLRKASHDKILKANPHKLRIHVENQC